VSAAEGPDESRLRAWDIRIPIPRTCLPATAEAVVAGLDYLDARFDERAGARSIVVTVRAATYDRAVAYANNRVVPLLTDR